MRSKLFGFIGLRAIAACGACAGLAGGSAVGSAVGADDAGGGCRPFTEGVFPVIGGAHWLDTADLNGDGIDDVIAATSVYVVNTDFWRKGIGVLIADGAGGFLPPVIFRNDVNAAAAADFDGDGDADILGIGQFPGDTELLLNDGAGVFTEAGPGPDTYGTCVYAVDIDLDGDPDLITGGDLYDTTVFLNDGTGGFTESSIQLGRFTYACEFADINGDGQPDALTLDGVRLAISYSSAPGVFGGGGSVIEGVRVFGAGDLDGDGDTDLLLIRDREFGEPAPYNSAAQVYFNDGSGAFTPGVRLPTDTIPRTLALGDADGDGDLDAAVQGASQTTILLNDGTGAFARGPMLDASGGVTRHAVFTDVDGDGDDDLVESNYGTSSVRLSLNPANGPDGGPAHGPDGRVLGDGVRLHPAPVGAGIIALADFDGDGTDDPFLITNVDGGGHTLVVMTRRADGVLDVAIESPVKLPAVNMLAGDLDGDGLADAVVGGPGGYGVYLNNGDGALMPAGETAGSVFPAALADLTGDGVLDLAAENWDSVGVCVGNGDGSFGDPVWRRYAGFTDLIDTDGDGVQEILSRVDGRLVAFSLADGSLAETDLCESPLSEGIAAGDVDGDGDDDIVWRLPVHFAGSSGLFRSEMEFGVFRNEGGLFVAGERYRVNADATLVTMADLDGDGAEEWLGHDPGTGSLAVFSFDEAGAPSLPVRLPLAFDYESSLARYALGDMNADGVTDFAWRSPQWLVDPDYRGHILTEVSGVGCVDAHCNPADLARPFGVLDLADITGFVAAFAAMDDAADLAGPAGVFDLSDIVAFVETFGAGCP